MGNLKFANGCVTFLRRCASRCGLTAATGLTLVLAAVAAGQLRLPVGPPLPLAGPGHSAGPMEARVATADLVVVAKLSEDAGIQNIELALPGATEAHTWELRRYNFQLVRTLFDRAGAAPASQPATVPTDKALAVLTPTQLPVREIGGVGVRPHLRMLMPPPPAVGNTYILFLNKLSQREEYYLQPAAPLDADDNTIAEVAAAAKVDQWPWGKAVDGLQLCLLIPPEVSGWAQDVQKGPGSVPLVVYVIVRNTGERPRRIVLGPETQLTFTATPANAQPISQRLLASAAYTQELKPGQFTTLSYSADGQGNSGGLFLQGMTPGECSFGVTFASPKSETPDTFSGELSSAAVKRVVKMEPQPPLIR